MRDFEKESGSIPGQVVPDRGVRDLESKRARDRASWAQRKLAEDPSYKFREVLRPAVWDETVLTERWEDRKARRAKERGQCVAGAPR